MAKTYSPEHVGKVYGVDPLKVKEWLNGTTEFAAANNSKFAAFLNLQPRSLKGQKKKKKLKNKLSLGFRQQQKDDSRSAKRDFEDQWKRNFQKIENCKYRESAKSQVDKLLLLAGENSKIRSKIKDCYNQLPSAREYVEVHCDKKYFTWHDLEFVEKGLKVNPNVCFLFIPINGPTKVLQEIQLDYFQKRYKKHLYKIFFNRETGKAELLLSDDISKIKRIVENHIHKKKRSKTPGTSKFVNERPVQNLNSFGDSKIVSIEDIIHHYSHNEYIQISAQLLRKKGKALAIWENNNGNLEESILIILEHRIYSFVIWENINENRACYVFKYKSEKFGKGLERLKKFVSVEIKYKRENLFRHYDLEDYELISEEYKAIIHENSALYKKSINDFISPFFSLK